MDTIREISPPVKTRAYPLLPPPPLPAQPARAATLLDWVEHYAEQFEAEQEDAGRLVAWSLRRLAADLRATGAVTAPQAEGRIEQLEQMQDDELADLREQVARLRAENDRLLAALDLY